MIELTKPDVDNLWNTISTLSNQSRSKEAKTLLKIVIENTIALSPFIKLAAEISSLVPSSKPIEPYTIGEMKETDEKLRETLRKKDYHQAKLSLIDYVFLMSDVFSDTKKDLLKQLLASLVSFPENQTNIRTTVDFVKDMYSPKDAAEILGLSDQTIRRMCEKGKFPGAKRTMGGHWRIPSEHFKVTKEQSQQIRRDIEDLRKKVMDGGEVDEFDLI